MRQQDSPALYLLNGRVEGICPFAERVNVTFHGRNLRGAAELSSEHSRSDPMRNQRTRQSIGWTGIFLLAFAGTGCGRGLLPQFLCGGQSCTTVASANDAPGSMKLAPSPGLAPGSLHGAEGVVAASYEPPSQVIATFSQRLAAVEDDRKVLTARLQQMDGLLEVRDQALFASAREVDAARTEITATRSEMDRWREKMAAQQERLRAIEKEDMGTLVSIIKLLEQAVEEGKELTPAKPPAKQPETKQADPRERE